MSEETAREVWTNAPEGFDPGDRNALHARFPDGFIVVQVDQGRTPSTPDNPSQGYRDFNAVTFHGVELQATVQFAVELEDVEGLGDAALSRVPSGSFEVIFAVCWRRDDSQRIDHCTGCGSEHEPQETDACPVCKPGPGLISTWGEAQAERFRSGERYATPQGERDQHERPGQWGFERREGGEVVYHAFADDEGPHDRIGNPIRWRDAVENDKRLQAPSPGYVRVTNPEIPPGMYVMLGGHSWEWGYVGEAPRGEAATRDEALVAASTDFTADVPAEAAPAEADTIETLRQRVTQLEASLRKESQRRSEENEKLRTLLHLAEDEATSQRQRAELAEQRISRVRDVLGRDEIAAALDLANGWDIERKRRDRG